MLRAFSSPVEPSTSSTTLSYSYSLTVRVYYIIYRHFSVPCFQGSNILFYLFSFIFHSLQLYCYFFFRSLLYLLTSIVQSLLGYALLKTRKTEFFICPKSPRIPFSIKVNNLTSLFQSCSISSCFANHVYYSFAFTKGY